MKVTSLLKALLRLKILATAFLSLFVVLTVAGPALAGAEPRGSPKGRVNAVAFSSDGRTVASGSADCTVQLWQVPTSSLVRKLQDHDGTLMLSLTL
jgi:WD40 repeat protein